MKTNFRKCIPTISILPLFIAFSCTNYQIPDNALPDGPGKEVPQIVETNCDSDTVYFQNTILPLVVSSCATTGCHDKVSHRDGIILTDYTSIVRTGEIKPGDPGDSEFFETLTDDGDDLMPPPPYSPLSTDQIQQVRTWISQGAKNNACHYGCDTTQITFSETIWPLMQSYCTGCHSSVSPGGGIVIAGYDDMVSLAENESLMGSIRYESAYSPMPINQQLPECSINQLQKWIDDGFPQ